MKSRSLDVVPARTHESRFAVPVHYSTLLKHTPNTQHIHTDACVRASAGIQIDISRQIDRHTVGDR